MGADRLAGRFEAGNLEGAGVKVTHFGDVVEVHVNDYYQYFRESGGRLVPCNFWGDPEPFSSVAAHKLPDEIEVKVLKRIKENA